MQCTVQSWALGSTCFCNGQTCHIFVESSCGSHVKQEVRVAWWRCLFISLPLPRCSRGGVHYMRLGGVMTTHAPRSCLCAYSPCARFALQLWRCTPLELSAAAPEACSDAEPHALRPGWTPSKGDERQWQEAVWCGE